MLIFKKKHVEALSVKPGPTESGTVRPLHDVVGGELLPVDKLSLFLSQYWILIVLMAVPLGFLLLKRRSMFMRLLLKLPFFR